MRKAVVLLSGGLDSTTLAYYARHEGYDLRLLSVHYGQRHSRELAAAHKVAVVLNASHKVIDLSVLRSVLSSSVLTGAGSIPHGHYEDESMRTTVVPNRNAILLSVAFGYAVTAQADVVAYAAHGGDHAIYPDCRPEFVSAFNLMQQTAVYPPAPTIWAPFLDKTKADIVSRAAELSVPVELTWSCYEGLSVHCGKCGTCVERREAFSLAGVSDPTLYA